MTISFVSSNDGSRFPAAGGTSDTTTGARTWTHSPVLAAPRGVLVLIVINGASTDVVSAVTYGGVALTRAATAADTAGEAGRVYAYFLGSGVPAGAQTVSVTRSGTSAMYCYAMAFDAGGNTEIAASGVLQEDRANPQVTLTTTAASLRYVAINSGLANTTDLAMTGDAGTTGLSLSAVDFGNQVGRIDRWVVGAAAAAPSAGSVIVGYTSASDDVAFVAVAVAEIAAAAASPPFRPQSRRRNHLIIR